MVLLGLWAGLPGGAAAQVAETGLARAHAHNDYEHAHPLFDALAQGFNSVEADIYLVDGKLLVAHNREDVRADRTLEALYLAPLRETIRERGGRVYPGLPPLQLLIDIKSDSEATYSALHEVLRRYADIMTIFTDEATVEGPVVAVVSGERPRGMMQAQPVRFAGYDGRLEDLEGARAEVSPSFMPLVSDSWVRITRWTGDGSLPDSARQEIARDVERAHAQGRKLRYWGAPDSVALWQALYDAGVDYLNADDLKGLRAFLLRQR